MRVRPKSDGKRWEAARKQRVRPDGWTRAKWRKTGSVGRRIVIEELAQIKGGEAA